MAWTWTRAATNIYSLGVLLYELLTGTPPLDQERLRQVSYDELRRLIREEEPPRPSTRISTLGPAAVTVSANRQSEPKQLSRCLRGDLDWIVMKALEKDRTRRYETASAFAADVQRYLKNEPVEACPPSVLYRFRKFARRRKGVFVTTAVVATAVVLAVASLTASTTLTWQANRDLRQALEREREDGYYQRIARAEREFSANNLGRMLQLRDECPEDLRGWEWHYLKRRGFERFAPLRQDDNVYRVAYSPTGQRFASATSNGDITIWDARTRAPISTFHGGNGHVESLAFSPDGQRLACNSRTGVVRIWDVLTGRELLAWPAHDGKALSLAYSADGRRLLSLGTEQSPDQAAWLELKVWDATSGRVIQTLPRLNEGAIRGAMFSPDGRYFAGGDNDGRDNTVKVWDARTGAELLALKGHTSRVLVVAFSDDGRFLASASGGWGSRVDGEVKVWELPGGRERYDLRGHTGYVQCLAFSSDGRRLASGGMDRSVKVWDLSAGHEAITLRGHSDYVWSLAFSPDSRQLISGSFDRSVRVWDGTPISEGAPEGPRTIHADPKGILGVAFHPDGRSLAATGVHGVTIWKLPNGQAGAAFPARAEALTCVAFSPDGARLACGGVRGDLRIGDPKTGRELVAFPGLTSLVTAVAFSPDGRYLVSGGGSQTARLLDAITGQTILTISPENETVLGLAFSLDSRRVAIASFDHGVRIWDVATHQVVAILQPPRQGRATAVAFRPDGKMLASASADGTVQLWDTQTWQRKEIVHHATGGVECLAFSPDSRVLAWGSTDATVTIASSDTGEVRATLRGHTSWVEGLAFSPDGAVLASGSLDGTVKLWPVPCAATVPSPADVSARAPEGTLPQAAIRSARGAAPGNER